MFAALPGEVVGVLEDVVDEDFGSRVDAEVAGDAVGRDAGAVVILVEPLQAEAGGLLGQAGDADDGVSGVAEDAAGIDGDAAVEADARVRPTREIDDGGREGVGPADGEEVVGVVRADGELDGDGNGALRVLRDALRVPAGDDIGLMEVVVDLDVALIVALVLLDGAHVVAGDAERIGGGVVGERVELGMGEEVLGDRVQNGDLVVGVGDLSAGVG